MSVFLVSTTFLIVSTAALRAGNHSEMVGTICYMLVDLHVKTTSMVIATPAALHHKRTAPQETLVTNAP